MSIFNLIKEKKATEKYVSKLSPNKATYWKCTFVLEFLRIAAKQKQTENVTFEKTDKKKASVTNSSGPNAQVSSFFKNGSQIHTALFPSCLSSGVTKFTQYL